MLAAGLVVLGCVVVLGLQGGPELDAGLEVGAGFADRFECAVQLRRAGAVAVAELPVKILKDPQSGKKEAPYGAGERAWRS